MSPNKIRHNQIRYRAPIHEFIGAKLIKTQFFQSDWPDMLRYARKLGVIVTYFNEKAIVRIGDKRFDDSCSLQKVLCRLTVKCDLEKAKQLSIQGPYLRLSGIQLKSSHSVLYNHENCPMCPYEWLPRIS